jgi:hypothetical protein
MRLVLQRLSWVQEVTDTVKIRDAETRVQTLVASLGN